MSDAQTEISVFMMGGRRTGKTTILASMKEQINDITSGTDLTITAGQGQDMAKLVKCSNALKKLLTRGGDKTFHPDENPTMEVDKYSFRVKSAGKSSEDSIQISFYDVPGEWFKDGLHDDEIMELVEKSQVFMIAIDTPSLMEEPMEAYGGVGRYNEDNNKTAMVTHYVKSFLTNDANKLVLFVPLKCEKQYNLTRDSQKNPYHKNYMIEVNKKVKEAYKDLIGYLRAPAMRDKCTAAITPIITVGGMEFDRFDGIDEESKLLRQNYRLLENIGYSPKFCEQPMLYTLAFAIEKYNSQLNEGGKKKKYGRLKKAVLGLLLSNIFGLIIGPIFTFFILHQDALNDIQGFLGPNKERLNRNINDGYEILQNPLNM